MNRVTKVPPIKSQGIKTKLVPWIKSILPSDFRGKWIEPFMGTGVVAFNVAPPSALLCDTNPHLINFYSQIATKQIEVGAFYWTVPAPDIVNSGREEQGLISV